MIFMMKRLQLSYCNSSKENNNQGMQYETIYGSPEIPRRPRVSFLENMQKHCMPMPFSPRRNNIKYTLEQNSSITRN